MFVEILKKKKKKKKKTKQLRYRYVDVRIYKSMKQVSYNDKYSLSASGLIILTYISLLSSEVFLYNN